MTGGNLTPRERVLRILDGRKPDRRNFFTGMSAITIDALRRYGYSFSEIHLDPIKMAEIGCSSYEMFGFESSNIPFDMGVEAEALGAEVNFYLERRDRVIFPTVMRPAIEEPEDLSIPENIEERGRIGIVTRACELIRDRVGDDCPIGIWMLGPFTLAGRIMDLGKFLRMVLRERDRIEPLLDSLSEFLEDLGKIYQEAGADFITVREMGASPDVVSPRIFKEIVAPRLEKLISRLRRKSPVVLHICGNADRIIEDMWGVGPNAISIERKCDLRRARELLGDDAVILGNVDPISEILRASPEDTARAVIRSLEEGASAAWPGCDLWPETRGENLRAGVEAARLWRNRDEG